LFIVQLTDVVQCRSSTMRHPTHLWHLKEPPYTTNVTRDINLVNTITLITLGHRWMSYVTVIVRVRVNECRMTGVHRWKSYVTVIAGVHWTHIALVCILQLLISE